MLVSTQHAWLAVKSFRQKKLTDKWQLLHVANVLGKITTANSEYETFLSFFKWKQVYN